MRRLLIIAVIAARATAQNSAPDEVAAVILRGHNELRALHQARALVFDEALVRYAQYWARHLAASGTFEHSGGPYGENLYLLSSTGPVGVLDAARSAVHEWAGEAVLYRYGDDSTHKTGHFTQMIWKSSLRMGCATARREKGRLNAIYVVCSYDPPGNFLGRFPQNVLP